MKITTANDFDRAVDFARGLLEKGPVEWACSQWKEPRSDPQNNALWGVAYKAIEEATGNAPQDLHEYFCGEFWGWVESTVMGRRKIKPRRTTTRDENGRASKVKADEFAKFYDFIQRRMAENGVYVPDPDPQWRKAA